MNASNERARATPEPLNIAAQLRETGDSILATTDSKASQLIEKHTIGYVPTEDRHGKVRDLFTLWFGGNIAPLPIVTGALGVQLFHLNLFWGIVACLVFLRCRNVYPLMLTHAILGVSLAITVPGPKVHNMRVGIGYLHYRDPAKGVPLAIDPQTGRVL